LVAKLSVVAVFAARLLVEERFKVAFNAAAELLVPAFVLEAFWVALAATAPPAAVVLFAAVLVDPELLPPPEDVLLEVELPNVFAVPFLPAAAKFRVEVEADVLLCVLALLAVAPNVAAAVWLLLAVSDAFVAKAFVVAPDLLEFSAKAFVVALDLFELLDSEAVSVAEAADCPPACWNLLLVELIVVESLCSFVLLSVNDEVSVVE
jgi:hypothetical protein